MSKYYLNYLDELESEAIYILREVWAQFENPVILFSGGKDSILVTHLAKKAFYPSKIPFALMHVDTGHNFPETIQFRNDLVEKLSVKLIVGSVQESIDNGRVAEEKGKNATRNALQITTLLDAIEMNKIDCAIGGGRRDEEKARAKERFFSHRDDFGQWDPKNQRPELWNLLNGKHFDGEHFRAFPISNWTEMDVWNYIKRENIKIPSLYFAHEREVVFRSNSWIPVSEYLKLEESEQVEKKKIRFRTLGDITITGGIESQADDLDKIVQEVSAMRKTERGDRSDDKRSETAMEDRKKQGYF
ncbi:sulfate adenylyltransferase subunit CysD [Salegentibacter mishustinae]|jgi:sulfate adenylyltransferase subunit 2|uniref:Sulfate adenylyltransferase subunit 2 n=1 Tax=Salegentibacter mishustinae TaxID=270918 RepID=A0A0Q9Z856_9FLAO|nr:sulfate adenylyltransferase subunit CysD [Salegentibacter mishustinae]KRG29151.1 sulfate adenylyltransferase [Salegentibacter mishustinae]PNW21797.1 sulfate adenylyltransferase [Salegentibacter mishustinae]PZX65141.1 sulfate adenylyltransferase subunit 2 [Salegentibacter mishustinae]GGW87066.1 sulfate adenylyltransferase [Salegentibacter mishustinae]